MKFCVTPSCLFLYCVLDPLRGNNFKILQSHLNKRSEAKCRKERSATFHKYSMKTKVSNNFKSFLRFWSSAERIRVLNVLSSQTHRNKDALTVQPELEVFSLTAEAQLESRTGVDWK